MAYTFSALAPEYARSWREMQINVKKTAIFAKEARDVLAEMATYKKVEAATGVPASVIAVIHNRESDRDFTTHLHNGDPLTKRTFHVPAGRPVNGKPPFTWVESAIDALEYERLTTVTDWTIERACYCLEKYNGWGYRRYHGVDSPYLWAGTNIQDAGKYVADGQWNRSAYDTQLGCMPLLYAIWQLDRTLALRLSDQPPILPEPDTPPPRLPPDVEPTPTPPQTGGFLNALAAWVRRLFQGE